MSGRTVFLPDGTISLGTDPDGTGDITWGKLATEAYVNAAQGPFQLMQSYITLGALGYNVAYFAAGNVSTGTTKYAWTNPYNPGKILAAYASVGTAPATSSILVDVNKNGTTIFTTQSNRITIAAGETLGFAVAVDVPDLGALDRITIDIDQIGTGTVGADLSVVLLIQNYFPT